MVAMVILTFLILGVFAGMLQAYKLSAHTRYRDHARYILRSLGDRFMIEMAEEGGALSEMFTITNGPTGNGLQWQNAVPDGSGTLTVDLGRWEENAPIQKATVTREVQYLSDAGTIAEEPPESTAGILVRGDFKISYTYNNKQVEQSLSLVRRVP